MRRDRYSNKLLFTLAALGIIAFVVLSYALLTGFSLDNSSAPGERFRKLNIGATTEDGVKDLIGEPDSVENRGGSKILTYDTKYEIPKDTVAIKNEKVTSYVESVFSDEEGGLERYKSQFGEPDLVLYDHNLEDFSWHIYLDEGLGIAASPYGHIGKIMRFETTNEENFLGEIAQPLGLSTKPHDHEEPPITLEP